MLMSCRDCGKGQDDGAAGPEGNQYCILPAGGKLCYPCAAEREKQNMRDMAAVVAAGGKVRPVVLYLTEVFRDNYERADCHVGNWTSEFKLPCRIVSRSRNNFNAERIDFRFDFEGREWYGRLTGDMQACRCRPTAGRKPGRPGWVTSTVADLARGILAINGFDRLPIMADAMEEAGYVNRRVLTLFREAPTRKGAADELREMSPLFYSPARPVSARR